VIATRQTTSSTTKTSTLVTDANTVAAQANYSLEPSFDFLETFKSPRHAFANQAKAKTEHSPNPDDFGKVNRTEAEIDTEIALRASISSSSICKDLEHIIPMALQTRFADKRGTCVASKVGKPFERCSLSGPSASITEFSEKISKCDFQNNHVEFIEHITQLARASMCGTHRNVALYPTRQAKLKGWVSGFSRLPNADRLAFQYWVTTISIGKSPTLTELPSAEAQSTTIQVKHEELQSSTSDTTHSEKVASHVLRNRVVYLPDPQPSSGPFAHYQPKWTKPLSVSHALQKVINEPLKPTDKKDGFIYIFWEEGHFGKVKIGRTNNLDRRLEEWNRDCNRKHAYHPATQRNELIEIPHVSRVERLIHIELKDQRRERHCESCNKRHQEWFEVGEAAVIQVFEKWRDWILQKPYALNQQTKQWVLRPEIVENLEQICEPTEVVNEKKPTPRPARKSIGRKRRSKRVTI
jgi:hypothetical protein